nr:MAG TPA: hypothetical protein [Caudoviricetes sp.]
MIRCLYRQYINIFCNIHNRLTSLNSSDII